MFDIEVCCFIVAMFDPVHDVKAVFHLPNMLTLCNFTGITHIPEKISRCCEQLT